MSLTQAIAKSMKRLQAFEAKYGMDSVEFYQLFVRGKTENLSSVDVLDRIRWAGEIELLLRWLSTDESRKKVSGDAY